MDSFLEEEVMRMASQLGPQRAQSQGGVGIQQQQQQQPQQPHARSGSGEAIAAGRHQNGNGAGSGSASTHTAGMQAGRQPPRVLSQRLGGAGTAHALDDVEPDPVAQQQQLQAKPRGQAGPERRGGGSLGASLAGSLSVKGATSAAALGAGAAAAQPSEEDMEKHLKKKEAAVREALKNKQQRLRQESVRLAAIDKELAQLQMEHQQEINELRISLEGVDKELYYLDRDHSRKKELYEVAKKALDDKLAAKKVIHTRLTELILASEQKRESKLNELMEQMDWREAAAAVPAAAGKGTQRARPGVT